jgi:hypothetical protein
VHWTGVARGHVSGDDEAQRRSLRAEALAGGGDPGAVAAFRKAIAVAPAADRPRLRARLARAAVLAGDLASAEDALVGPEPDGGAHDVAILLASGMVAYLRGDLATAESVVTRLRGEAAEPGAPDRLLDVITLQGMVAPQPGRAVRPPPPGAAGDQ